MRRSSKDNSGPVRAITFDFWRTLYYAQSRLPERRKARVEAVVNATGASNENAKEAMKFVGSEFLRIHIAEQRTLEPNDAIPLIEAYLGTPIETTVAATLADELADALLEHPPEPIEGALEAVRAAAERVPVGIISDTGISPGSRIQALLKRAGFLDHITGLTFSDEVGVAKPQVAMFHDATTKLNVPASALLHIGDLEPTDVRGALDFGSRAAIFAGDNERFANSKNAHYVFTSWAEFIDKLPQIVG